MSGKNTAAHGKHWSRDSAVYVRPLSIPDTVRRRLSDAVGRDLCDEELARIGNALDTYREWALQRALRRVTQQDKITTLAAISKAGDGQVYRMMALCDAWTKAEIDTQIHLEGWPRDLELRPVVIRLAAAKARDRIQAKRPAGGRRTAGYQAYLVASIFSLWASLGRASASITFDPKEPNEQLAFSPLIRFAQTLFEIVEGEQVGLEAVKKRLQRLKPHRRKV